MQAAGILLAFRKQKDIQVSNSWVPYSSMHNGSFLRRSTGRVAGSRQADRQQKSNFHIRFSCGNSVMQGPYSDSRWYPPDYITQVISAWTTFYTYRRCTCIYCIYSLRKMGRCWHDLKPVTRYNRKTATKDTTDRQRQPDNAQGPLCVSGWYIYEQEGMQAGVYYCLFRDTFRIAEHLNTGGFEWLSLSTCHIFFHSPPPQIYCRKRCYFLNLFVHF